MPDPTVPEVVVPPTGTAPVVPTTPVVPVVPAADTLDLTIKPVVEQEPPAPDTGDPALDLALQFYAKMGIKDDDPALIKAQSGDFTLLEAKLSVLGDKAKGWEKYLVLGKNAYATAKTQAETRIVAAKADILKVVGNEEEWTKVREWAALNATDDEKKAATAALQQGGLAAKAMAQYLHNMYQASPGAVKTPANTVRDGAAGKPAIQAPMSALEYGAAVTALRMKLSGDLDGSAEYKALQARRLAAMNAGY